MGNQNYKAIGATGNKKEPRQRKRAVRPRVCSLAWPTKLHIASQDIVRGWDAILAYLLDPNRSVCDIFKSFAAHGSNTPLLPGVGRPDMGPAHLWVFVGQAPTGPKPNRPGYDGGGTSSAAIASMVLYAFLVNPPLEVKRASSRTK